MHTSTHVSMLVLLAAFLAATAQAQSTSTEQLVRAQDDRERIAALSRDVSALEALWSDEFTVNAPNNQIVVGRQQNLDTFVRGGIIVSAK